MAEIKTAMALVVILAVGLILIAPDFGDDVEAALPHHHLFKVQRLLVVSAVQFLPLAFAALHSLMPLVSTLDSRTPELLDLVCTRRC